jgi:hypothetical protein
MGQAPIQEVESRSNIDAEDKDGRPKQVARDCELPQALDLPDAEDRNHEYGECHRGSDPTMSPILAKSLLLRRRVAARKQDEQHEGLEPLFSP